jgi:hypothetical protein
MNCKRENYEAFIIFKTNAWNEIATRAIDKHQRAWGAKNYRRLVRAHPEIFAPQGPTELNEVEEMSSPTSRKSQQPIDGGRHETN